MDGLIGFLERWHCGAPAPAAPSRAFPPGQGPLRTPADPDFEQVLEPGVAALVQSCVGRGWVTYSSCEGHPSEPGRPQLAPRHVGLLITDPRVESDLKSALDALCRSHPEPRIQVVPRRVRVTSEVGEFDGFDMVFVGLGIPEEAYFERVDRVTEALVALLS